MTSKPHPELHRVANAAIVAAFAAVGSVAAAALALLATQPGAVGGIIKVFVFGFFLGVPLAALHAFALGLPLYLLLRRRWILTPGRAVLGGFAVGSTPWMLLGLGTGVSISTVAGTIGFAGLPGAVGGFVFCAMLRE